MSYCLVYFLKTRAAFCPPISIQFYHNTNSVRETVKYQSRSKLTESEVITNNGGRDFVRFIVMGFVGDVV